MKLEKMTFTQHEEEGAIPETITITLTAREIVWLGALLGRQNHTMIEEVLPGFQEENSEIYHGITGDVANRFFDEGLGDWIRVVR